MMPSRPIAAVLLALAGCGGSDDAIDAAQIVPGAATKVVSATLDTADVWTSTATNHILQSVTITNDDTVSRTVLLTGSLTYTFPGGIAAGNAIYGWCRQSTDAFAVGAADFTHTVQATDDRNWTVAFNRQYALAAGATGIYYLVGRESSFTTNVTYFGENIRAELIKR